MKAGSATHHDFETLIHYLRWLRATGTWGTTELVWKEHDVVHVRHTHSFRPGELPVTLRGHAPDHE